VRLYGIFDRKMREYGQLMQCPNDETACRLVVDGIRGAPDSVIARHPGDFELRCVGQFDPQLGVLEQGSGEPRLVEEVHVLIVPPLPITAANKRMVPEVFEGFAPVGDHASPESYPSQRAFDR